MYRGLSASALRGVGPRSQPSRESKSRASIASSDAQGSQDEDAFDSEADGHPARTSTKRSKASYYEVEAIVDSNWHEEQEASDILYRSFVIPSHQSPDIGLLLQNPLEESPRRNTLVTSFRDQVSMFTIGQFWHLLTLHRHAIRAPGALQEYWSTAPLSKYIPDHIVAARGASPLVRHIIHCTPS